jgi:ferredoxin
MPQPPLTPDATATATGPATTEPGAAGSAATGPAATGPAAESTVTIRIGRKTATLQRLPDETILQTARRAGLNPPYSCEAGNCATCMALVEEGEVTMRVNDALTDDDLADGYVLTCQGEPVSETVVVLYE